MSIETPREYSARTRREEDLLLTAAADILRRRMESRPTKTFTAPDVAGQYASMRLSDDKLAGREHFMAMYLDTRHRLISDEILFSGTIDGAEVHPREVVKGAMNANAAAVILAHNHPSGDTTPSAADRAVTARLKQALALVEVRLLDHFVVGDGPPMSMASRGWV